MPRVPRQEERQITGGLTRLGRENQNPAFTGSPEADRAIEEAVGQAGELVRREEDRADRARARKADNELRTSLNDLQNSYSQERGEDALKKITDYDKKLSSRRDELRRGMNVRQQRMFDNSAAETDRSWRRFSLRHATVESDKLAAQEEDVGLESALQSATLNSMDPVAVEEARRRTASVMEERSERLGHSPKVAKQYRLEADSSLNYGVTKSMVDAGAWSAAKDHFEKNKKNMTADDISKAEKLVNAGVRRGMAQDEVDRLFEGDTSSLGALLDEARKQKDPEMRDEVVRRVKQRWSDEAAAAKVDYDNIFSVADEWVKNNRGKDPGLMEPSVWESLSRKDQDVLRKVWKNPATDPQAYVSLLEMAENGTLKDLEPADFRRHWSRLDDGDRKRMEKLWLGARKNTDQSDFISTNNLIVQQGIKYGLLPNKKKSKYSKDQLLTLMTIQKSLADAARQDGVKKENLPDFVDKYLARTFVDKAWAFDPNERPQDVPLEKRTDTYFPVGRMSQAEIREIDNFIRSVGGTGRITNDLRQRVYPQLNFYDDREAAAAIVRDR